MGQKIYREVIKVGLGEPIIGANSITITENDPLYIDSNGFLTLATAGSLVLGVARQTVTLSSSNQTVAKVTPSWRPVEGLRMLFGADQACTQTDVGAYADFGTVTTGAFSLNLVAGSSGQTLVLQFNPDQDTTTSDVVVSFAEPQSLAYAQV